MRTAMLRCSGRTTTALPNCSRAQPSPLACTSSSCRAARYPAAAAAQWKQRVGLSWRSASVKCAAVDGDAEGRQPQPTTPKSDKAPAADTYPSSLAVRDEEPQSFMAEEEEEYKSPIQKMLYPDEALPENFEMPIWDHLEELRERVFIAGLAAAASILTCFCFSKELIIFLEAPVAESGVRFLQLSPGEFFFTTLKTAGYSGLLVAAPTVLYEIIAYVLPGLTNSERKFLAPIVFGSSILFYFGLIFSYEILTPAALNFFVSYAEGAVESLWSIDQYFEFVLVLMFSTGLSFQVPVIQVMLGQLGIVNSEQMFGLWRYVVVGSTVVAAVLTPSTDPFTQALLAIPLVGLYFGGAAAVRAIEQSRDMQKA